MGFIIAIEPDPKTTKDIVENWAAIAQSLNHKVLTFQTLAAMEAEWTKPEMQPLQIALIMIPAEPLPANPLELLSALKTKFNCEILITLFDNPKITKNLEQWPVQNFIFKPFDLTILKEHTRFALLNNRKVDTKFVHTTAAKAEIESLKKFKIVQMTEFGFKITQASPLAIGSIYKFYHPLFQNQKQQSIWARVVSAPENTYELIFCQVNAPVLAQIRKRIVAAPSKVRGATWAGRISARKMSISIFINLSEQGQSAGITDLINRNFININFIDAKDLTPGSPVDLVISDANYEKKDIEANFGTSTTYISIVTKPLKREELEGRFALETVRFEKALDKALLMKLIKQLFPFLKEKDPAPTITINFDEHILLSDVLSVSAYSEAAISFKNSVPTPVGTFLVIALSQEDETLVKEMKAKVHFVSEKPDKEQFYEHQLLLFGMKDEFLKLIRLWILQRHIHSNKGN